MKEIKYNQIEQIEKQGLDLSILKKRSNAKTHDGWLLGRIKICKKEKNFELAMVYQEVYNNYMNTEKKSKIELKSWKGQSGIKLINKPDRFIVITFQKTDQDSEPKEVKREITKKEINDVIKVINRLENIRTSVSFNEQIDYIHTREIGEGYYRDEWDKIFADRFRHTQLNYILRILDYLDLIKYRGGKTKIINNKTEIQLII